MSDSKKRLSFSEAARELQVSEDELEKLVADGEIASVKEGDTLFFKPEAIAQFKKTRKTEPTIILSDDEMDLLDGVEDISLDDLDLGEATAPAAAVRGEPEGGLEALDLSSQDLDLSAAESADAAAPAAAGREVDIEDLDLGDLSLDDEVPATETAATGGTAAAGLDDIALEEPATADTRSDTVLSLDGLLDEEDASESTTPVPGVDVGDLELADTSDDITMEGTVSDDDTILDTDVLDLTDEADFQLDATSEGAAGTDASTLLRGGGARVMQMKRVKGHPVMTAILLVTSVLLLAPLAVLVNVYYFDSAWKLESSADATRWIESYNPLRGAFESTADTLRNLVR